MWGNSHVSVHYFVGITKSNPPILVVLIRPENDIPPHIHSAIVSGQKAKGENVLFSAAFETNWQIVKDHYMKSAPAVKDEAAKIF